jgi:transcriptional regulator with XRE-family HTH domain
MGTSKLRVLLAERDMQIKELAAASGVSYSTLKGLVSGRNPTEKNAYAVAEALGLHVSKVFPDWNNKR